MSKVRLTVTYNNSNGRDDGVFVSIQDVDINAQACADNLAKMQGDGFVFGSCVIYTNGVRSFVFEDVGDEQ